MMLLLTEKILLVEVERKKALFSSWYEVFPRSTSPVPGNTEHSGMLKNVIPLVAKMGFDILYFPPIHPIGISFRKGKGQFTCSRTGNRDLPGQ
jgi:starch synthase (maltosyl-transferring)